MPVGLLQGVPCARLPCVGVITPTTASRWEKKDSHHRHHCLRTKSQGCDVTRSASPRRISLMVSNRENRHVQCFASRPIYLFLLFSVLTQLNVRYLPAHTLIYRVERNVRVGSVSGQGSRAAGVYTTRKNGEFNKASNCRIWALPLQSYKRVHLESVVEIFPQRFTCTTPDSEILRKTMWSYMNVLSVENSCLPVRCA